MLMLELDFAVCASSASQVSASWVEQSLCGMLFCKHLGKIR